MIESQAGKKAIGVAAGTSRLTSHTAVWTEEGELFAFGDGDGVVLGHGKQEHEHVPE